MLFFGHTVSIGPAHTVSIRVLTISWHNHHADEHGNSCRATLQAVNLVLAVAGLCMLGYAAYMFIDFENITFSREADSGKHHDVAHWLMAAKENASPWYGRGLLLFASLC